MNSWHLDGHMSFSVGQRSSAGVKPQNEDAIGIRIPENLLLSTKGAVAVIADGVSAAEAGKEASETCVYSFLSDYYSTPDTWSVKKSTSKTLTALNRWLYSQGRQFNKTTHGYLSTMSFIVFKSRTAHLFHVGDTRIYRLRGSDFEQLTRDHSSQINEEKSYLTRAMGLDIMLDVDYSTLNLEIGDVFFLSSDGIHNTLNDKIIRDHLTTSQTSYEDSCDQLISLALQHGSRDNLSCQILRIDSLPHQTSDEACSRLTELPFPPILDHGMILDGLRVEKEIHASNRSQLYLVTQITSGAQFCMKTPSINYDDNPAYIERFIMESWIGARIQNPHVAKVIETGQQKTCLYYLTEYIDGISLQQWIKENPNPDIKEVIYIIAQVVKGIRAFHRREILHQDIKPANIMLDRHGEAKIIDFGSCVVKGISEIDSPIERDDILGTAGYSAPEVILDNPSTIQSEVFSLSVIVFEMLTGEPPFSGQLNHCRSAKAYLKTQYTAAFDLNPMVPVWLDGAIKKGLRFNPERRYADESEFLYELEHPNPKYKRYYRGACLNKNPLRFWQSTSAILLLLLLGSLFF
jgi:serine/threonine protein phosphatase PrpC